MWGLPELGGSALLLHDSLVFTLSTVMHFTQTADTRCQLKTQKYGSLRRMQIGLEFHRLRECVRARACVERRQLSRAFWKLDCSLTCLKVEGRVEKRTRHVTRAIPLLVHVRQAFFFEKSQKGKK